MIRAAFLANGVSGCFNKKRTKVWVSGFDGPDEFRQRADDRRYLSRGLDISDYNRTCCALHIYTKLHPCYLLTLNLDKCSFGLKFAQVEFFLP